MWIFYSLIGAAGQAIQSAIKKKTLQASGMNNVIGFVSFMVAGLAFWLLYFMQSGALWWDGELSVRFWQGMFWYAGLNVLAVYFAYKALDLAEFSYLMPFMTLTSVTVIVPAMIVFGEYPTIPDYIGIVLVVLGAILMNWKGGKGETKDEASSRRSNRKGLWFFLITALCYTIAPTAAKVTIMESSVAFASFLVHILIGIGFLVLVFLFGEKDRLREVFSPSKTVPRSFVFWVAIAGLIIALENGAINTALGMNDVVSVMAIKRLMPFFAFLIAFVYFRERTEIPKKLIATALMVAGAVLVTIW
ncbi:MAG: EamA family transporter [Candidatus Moranbacteria bacterium]|nr:EamA family transporter [Candidatus Moranbacteria bacterium]NTW75559.1 EamA family transporter [Candidatus Moranbacteria bacterium]